jgi:hypothetical protein
MPGQLGYKTTRNITLFSHIDPKATSSDKIRPFGSPNLSDIKPGESKTFHFDVSRNLTDLDYAHIRSVVDYKENYAL